MIFKHKKNSFLFPLGIVAIIFLTLAFTSKDLPSYGVLKEDMVQLIMSTDPGFSHQSLLLGSDPNTLKGDSEIAGNSKLIQYITLAPRALLDSIDYKLNGIRHERLDLDIPFLSHQSILADRDSALKNILNINPAKVKAKLRFQGTTYISDIRLKGDAEDHWTSQYRMSLRISLKGDRTLLGFKEFSLQKPNSRQFPYDYSYQSTLSALGNITSAHKFVHLYVNGRSWGIMNLEEHMTKEFLEKQKRKESIIIKFGDETKWAYNTQAADPYPHYILANGAFTVNVFQGGEYLGDSRYRKLLTYITKKQLHYNLELYDSKSMLNSYIASTLWAQWHNLLDTNHRYYLNPYTLKLESIGADQSGFKPLVDFNSIGFAQLPIQFSKVLRSLKDNDDLNDRLSLIIGEVKNPYHFTYSSKFFPLDQPLNIDILSKNTNEFLLNQQYYLSPTPVDHRGYLFSYPSLKFSLPSIQQASDLPQHVYFNHYEDGTIEIFNLLPDEVTITDIYVEGMKVGHKKINYKIPGYRQPLEPTLISSPFKGVYNERVVVLSSYKGFKRETKNRYTLSSERVHNPLSAQNFKCSDFCKADKKNYIFKKGLSLIEQPMVINGDVVLQPGTHLSFSPNAYLIINGSLLSKGTANSPVLMDASSDYWKGLYVFNASKQSILEHTKIRNLSALEDGILQLTGAITFYNSEVDLNNVIISDVIAEDAINIVHSKYRMKDVSIFDAASDAFDSDFSDGAITDSSFKNIAGDGIDFSGSKATIKNVNISSIGDKGISAGEQSTILISNALIENVVSGVVSKDNSNVILEDSKITNFQSYGVMSFIKKDFYSNFSSVIIKNSVIDPQNAYMRQQGTLIEVDSLPIPQQEFNVKRLYDFQPSEGL